MAILFRQFLKLGIREIKVSGLFCKLTSGLIVKKIFFVESSSEEKEIFMAAVVLSDGYYYGQVSYLTTM